VPHFLIIDDDAHVGTVLTRMLTEVGHSAVAVQSAEAGLDAAIASPPDAILVDFRMPGVTGVEFLRRLRQHEVLREVPVAVVTGDHFLDDELQTEIRALGAAVGYKPLWLEEVVGLARALTQRGE
jgi:CheY-like chemotaxis protein